MELWVDKYRPTKIEDYVWSNDHLKAKVMEYIENKSIPNLMLSGKPGTGKCLDYHELITVIIHDVDLANSANVTVETETNIAIGDLFKALDVLENTYNDLTPIEHVSIKTPTGFTPIIGVVRKLAEKVSVTLSDKSTLVCAKNHLVFERGHCKAVVDCDTIDTVTGSLMVKSVEVLDKGDVFDVSIAAPHVYVTPNGILHHNTSLAKLLLHQMGVDSGDILEINASKERRVDDLKDKIVNFVSTMPFGDYKYILLDEADTLSKLAQQFLRNEIERYQDTCRFILTNNYPERIIPAINSRCQHYSFNVLDKNGFTERVVDILLKEKVKIETLEDQSAIERIINISYPDMRKCINMLDQFVINGVVTQPPENVEITKDYLLEMVNLIKQGKLLMARKLVVSSVQDDEYEDVYRWLYENLNIWSDDEMVQNNALLVIRKALVNHAMIADAEINLSACLVELSNLS